MEAGTNSFPHKTRHTTKPWVSDRALDLLKKARSAALGDADQTLLARNRAKRSGREDLIAWVHRQLTKDQNGDHSTLLGAVRRQKSRFRG